MTRLDAIFQTQGAEQLLPAGGRPAWTEGWDRLYATAAPGGQALYAVAEVDANETTPLRARLDGLVGGLTERGAISGPPLALVVVAVARGIDPARVKPILNLRPSAFVAGLRPSTWLVDLATDTVRTGTMLGKPEGAGWIEQAVGEDSAEDLIRTAPAHAVARRLESDRFYALMRGRQPIVTYALIALNVAIYGLEVRAGGPYSDRVLNSLGALSYRQLEAGQWWRLFTMMFLHASPEHILFNMTSLFAVGTLSERLYGSRKFLLIYIGSGLIGALVSFAWWLVQGHNVNTGAVGASGAIFGVAAALATVQFQPSDVIPYSLRRRITSSMAPLVVLSLVLSQVLASNVDMAAHVGGILGGLFLSMIFRVSGSPHSLPRFSRIGG